MKKVRLGYCGTIQTDTDASVDVLKRVAEAKWRHGEDSSVITEADIQRFG